MDSVRLRIEQIVVRQGMPPATLEVDQSMKQSVRRIITIMQPMTSSELGRSEVNDCKLLIVERLEITAVEVQMDHYKGVAEKAPEENKLPLGGSKSGLPAKPGTRAANAR